MIGIEPYWLKWSIILEMYLIIIVLAISIHHSDTTNISSSFRNQSK